jgi:uncharacterized protein
MRQKIPSTQRGLLEIDWPLFGELIRALALRVAQHYDPEVIVGVAKAGVIPGAVVASILQRDFAPMAITRRRGGDAPELVAGPAGTLKGRRVLLVDETCDTGRTLTLAADEVRSHKPAEIRTAVSIRTGAFEPDFYALETDKLIVLPWDREVVEAGELVVRPDLAAYLAGEE